MSPDPIMNLFGMPVRVNPNMPDDMVLIVATCGRCGHATALHLAMFGCTECAAWPEDLRCKGEAVEGGRSIALVGDLDAFRDTLAAQQRERSEPQ